MKLSLLVMTAGKQEGKLLQINVPSFVVGRDPDCQLRPASPLISKRHCAILQKDGKVFIEDYGSTNGTFVNEERVEGTRELHHDDVLKIGPITFTVRIDRPVASRTPAPAVKPTTTLAPAAKPAAPPAKAKSDTPIPATAAKKPGEDDDIAAMLLDMDDGDSPSEGGIPAVPEGSTVFDMKIPPEVAAASDKAGAKPGQAPAKPAPTGDTRSAAAKLLEKLTKRPRT